jgi:hypothetical protein
MRRNSVHQSRECQAFRVLATRLLLCRSSLVDSQQVVAKQPLPEDRPEKSAPRREFRRAMRHAESQFVTQDSSLPTIRWLAPPPAHLARNANVLRQWHEPGASAGRSDTVGISRIRRRVPILLWRRRTIWPSTMMAERIMARFCLHGHAYRDQSVTFAEVGHPMPYVYLPTRGNWRDSPFAVGGTPEGMCEGAGHGHKY